MKTSNKILLIASLSSLGLLGLVHLVLYAEYRSGNMLTEKDLHNEQFQPVNVQAPEYLLLRGLLRVHIIPSDTFSVEFEKTGGSGQFMIDTKNNPSQNSKPVYQQVGDSLVISGANSGGINRNINTGFIWNFPRVNIYCRGLKGISVENGQTILEGDSTFVRSSIQLTANNALVWVGLSGNPEFSHSKNPYCFDSLSFHLLSSTLLLNNRSIIRYLHVDLDDQSRIDDHHAEIAYPDISGTAHSQINLSGATLRKLMARPPSP